MVLDGCKNDGTDCRLMVLKGSSSGHHLDNAEMDGQWELDAKSATFAQLRAKILISTSHSSNQYPAHPVHHVLICPEKDKRIIIWSMWIMLRLNKSGSLTKQTQQHFPNFQAKILTSTASVTLKIHMYRSDTKCRERNIGSYITIHLIFWRATLTFLWRLTLLLITVKHHLLLRTTLLDEKVQRPSLPVSDTMAYVPFPTFGITSNTQTWDHTPQL
jgi:hypothetical protein